MKRKLHGALLIVLYFVFVFVATLFVLGFGFGLLDAVNII